MVSGASCVQRPNRKKNGWPGAYRELPGQITGPKGGQNQMSELVCFASGLKPR